MTGTKIGWMVAGALALAAVAWVQPAEVEAAPNSNHDAAKYVGLWPDPGSGTTHWDISISSTGDVKGSYRETASVVYTSQGGYGSARVHITNTGTMTGVLANGVLSIAGTQTQETSSKDAPSYNYTSTYDFARTATIVPDANGNLQGVASTGETFVWWVR